MTFDLASVAAITVICYLMALGLKQHPDGKKWVTVCCGALGGILGGIGLYVIPDYPAGDIITAIAVGILSGMAASGLNQTGAAFGKKR